MNYFPQDQKSKYQLITHLLELMSKHGSWKAQKHSISSFLLENTAMLEDIQNKGISDIKTAANLLVLEDTIKNFNHKKLLFNRVLSDEIIIILPLPYTISDLILPFLSVKRIFSSLQLTSLDLQKIRHIRALAVEGYVDKKCIYINRDIIQFIAKLPSNNLREIFVFHSITSFNADYLRDTSNLTSIKVIPV
jgi:hypothetical protein